MFKLNLKIALRNLWKHKTSSIINVVGLAIGLASCLLLLLYVSYEWSFDKKFKGSESVYQVMTNFVDAKGNNKGTVDLTSNAIAQVIKQEIPDIDAISRISNNGQQLIANGENSFKKESKYADPDILKIFNYEFIAGNPETALNTPKSVILTERMAKLLFKDGDALNKSVRYNNQADLMVTGIVKNLPANSSNTFDFLMPWSLFETLSDWVKRPDWGNYNWQTVVRVNDQANIPLINSKMKGIIKKNSVDATDESFIFKLSDRHLFGKFVNGKSVGGDIERIYLFIALAVGILLIACINFMNMATAKSERRAKEVGIKKTIGASRASLISQFLTESILLTVISVLVAIVLVEILLPTFNNLLNIELSIDYYSSGYWIGILSVILLTGLLSGSYPALYLSAFNPIQTLKRKVTRAKVIPVSLRQVLVIGQFSFAIILIIATLVIYKQVQFIKDRPVGYDLNLLAEMPQEGELVNKFDLFKTELLKSGAVTALCQSSGSLSNSGSSFWNFEWPGMTKADKDVIFNQIATTYDFTKTNGIQMVSGRDFSKSFASDTAALMLSSTAAKLMGLKNPIGTPVKYHGNDFTVVGVFKDFIWGSPYYTDRPMVVAFSQGWGGQITMRLNPNNSLTKNVELISQVTKQINPAYPVDLKFVNDLYAVKLQGERVLGILSNLFGGLAIFISCLGLFGLAAYSAEQRTKEFGVRKVLGASVASIMQLLSVSFMKMILVAMIIGVPVAYYLMNKWLGHFDFRTTISWWIIVMAISGTTVIAFLTVSFQAYKAAKANPVDALKYE
ncbi:ABC transporter permease [Pedobacter foliorum]|uniref:ABC transporter permease n=1 Tax=Pedobacter foliorum TaxID=2739058 RepID=UPI001564A60C|nr:ABC transporter permease [Pedobacter foliorum]NRF40831.1 ABC transporter permease [Pedobacter foliorum]